MSKLIKIDTLKFFQPTPEYRKLVILEALYENPNLSQKELSAIAGVVPSLVNKYINELEKKGYIETKDLGKNKIYNVTGEGLSELYFLKLSFFNDIVNLSKRIDSQLENIFLKLKGKNEIGIYGAGLVGKVLAELLLNRGYNIVVYFDDDNGKVNSRVFGIPILPLNSKVRIDALVVASIKNSEQMVKKAKKFDFTDIYVFKTEEFKLSWHG
ncbi:MAG: hypothetical protein PWQ83_555 [Thermosipho sp. (in: thermotogales)]|nr:hypothetical protein [Thermosipho sp. (in: thermotogales)]